MDIFIQLHRSKIKVSEVPLFEPIFINIKDIIMVEPSDDTKYGSEVYIRDIETYIPFYPLFCKETYEEIITLLKEKGVELICP